MKVGKENSQVPPEGHDASNDPIQTPSHTKAVTETY